ncbi:sigma factor G inhibitor Gin [Halalkalibacterium halodurans]|uniref:Sigma-F transcribed protein n=1 Tax=Halalkalibacterium halodurans TaxID=86665 RepID=A0A0M0KDF3_ALKHA|nr:sigma factor G inhibitor Gin [Halalkalibacterium halodurans]MED3645613.1 sigma factor G inhibitor Gin [Halalkalibacterium halodurans]TPE68535.1 sigma-F transcribed protein [Halalkalibacterium halodurans]
MNEPKGTTVQERKRCVICEQPRPSGIQLFESFICEGCEQEIVKTEIEDMAYYHFVLRLKKIALPKT